MDEGQIKQSERAVKVKRVLEVELLPEVHFSLKTAEGHHTSANFIVQAHMDNVYRLVNPKKEDEFILLRVVDPEYPGPLSAKFKEVMGGIFGGELTNKAEVLSMSPALAERLVPPHTLSLEDIKDVVQSEPRLKS